MTINTIKKLKNTDKFYTSPEVAKIFVDKINTLTPLIDYDLVLEPAAGSGNILQFLPKNSVGMDLYPDAENIKKQNFLEYLPAEFPLHRSKRIACITNPPFGRGYMNPTAKAFFNHAAIFCTTIGFIVPLKWQTSWKVQKQLNKDFKLYLSEFLPENSFLLDNVPYNVNCCMQLWSRENLGTDMRIQGIPPTAHPDFDMFLTCDNVPRRSEVKEQLRKKQYWEFGLKYWGNIKICEMSEISPETTVHYLFKPNRPYVRHILENVNWQKYISNMGAPNVGGKSILINAYTQKKAELGYTSEPLQSKDDKLIQQFFDFD